MPTKKKTPMARIAFLMLPVRSLTIATTRGPNHAVPLSVTSLRLSMGDVQVSMNEQLEYTCLIPDLLEGKELRLMPLWNHLRVEASSKSLLRASDESIDSTENVKLNLHRHGDVAINSHSKEDDEKHVNYCLWFNVARVL